MSNLNTALEQGLTPDVIDDTNPDDIYLGYFRYDKITNPNLCLIKRITKVAGITTIKYPAGKFDYLASWENRANYEFRFRDFPFYAGLGMYYNLAAATDVRGIAPAGYSLPTPAQITTLLTTGSNDGFKYRKQTNIYAPLGWVREGGAEATNITGFSALPAGWSNGNAGDQGKALCFWSNLRSGNSGRYGVIYYNNYMQYSVTSIGGTSLLSVRLIKNTNIFDPNEIVTDNDGNKYSTCQPNPNQVWINSNLKVTRFNNGEFIPLVSDDAWMGTFGPPAMCYPLNNKDNV